MTCDRCYHGAHDECRETVPTGRQIPDRDPYRDRDRMLTEWTACTCPVCAEDAA